MDIYQENINGKDIIISEGGASIVDKYGDLSLPSFVFDGIIKKHGFDIEKIKLALIKYYETFFNTTI